MKKKANLILILFLYTIIGLTDLAKADVLFHWNFDGILGEDMTLVTDKTSMVDLKKFKKPGIIADVTYGRPNPWMNTFGTSAEFFNDFTGPSRGAALAAMDIDSVLNLSGLDSFTIEFFLYPFAIKDCTLLGKGSGSKGYRIDMTTQGSLRFWINGDHNTIQTDPNTISRNRWYHIAVTYERHHISDPMSIFVNGSLRQSGGSSSAIQNTTTFFCVGRWTNQDPFTSFSYDQRDSYFSGRIDELRVSNEVLSPPEFLYHAARNKASYPYPENCAEQFSRTTDLRWQPAQDIERQWIYFGTDSNQLQLICEVGPDVNTISNATLGIALEAGQTYYWRIDHEETGDTWNFTTQDGLVKGNLKWLLHLGQTYDHVISNPWNITVDEISQSNGSAFAPAPGQIYNLSDSPMQGNTTNTTMIWTPMYNADGIFPCDNRFPNLHFYHVYVISPYNQVAQLCILSFGELAVWQNGQQVMPYQNSSSEAYPCQEISLNQGSNAFTFAVYRTNLAVCFKDPNGNELTNLTYSLNPPLSERGVLVCRELPDFYDTNESCHVTLTVEVNPNSISNEINIIEYIPEGLIAAETGSGRVIGNAIWWTFDPNEENNIRLSYSLSIQSDVNNCIPFCGYVYSNNELEHIFGDDILFAHIIISPVDMANPIETIEINAEHTVNQENVIWEELGPGMHYDGLRATEDGGWAEYEFFVEQPGTYQVLLDYSATWTMFHHSAGIKLIFNDKSLLNTSLFPTIHTYMPTIHAYSGNYYPRPNRPAKRWTTHTAGIVELAQGEHTLRLIYEPVVLAHNQDDMSGNGRPVVKRITLSNYPGLVTPRMAEPHHLDSYEHPPARLVYDRDIMKRSDGCVEITYHGTFYSMSQGNEIYYTDGYVCPRLNADTPKFEIISIEPKVFHLPSEGEQEFQLTVRSNVAVDPAYSEMIILWLHGTNTNPLRKPYLFTTAQQYMTLPPFLEQEFPWREGPLLIMFSYRGRHINQDIRDPADMFIPCRWDLGFDRGRYLYDPVDFFRLQLREGYLPSVRDLFVANGWTEESWKYGSWEELWCALWSSLYARHNITQTKQYIRHLAENAVFYPVSLRWDWARPSLLPPPSSPGGEPMQGFAAPLAAHIGACQAGVIEDDQQFKILHNLVLPSLNSFWHEIRTTAVLARDANVGDTELVLNRSFYGDTGSWGDGFHQSYIKLGEDVVPAGRLVRSNQDVVYELPNRLVLPEPLTRAYAQGTSVRSWAYLEDIELEGLDLWSLLPIAGASRDPAVIEQVLSTISEILDKQKIFLEDGSFRNQPGSYGTGNDYYFTTAILKRLFPEEILNVISDQIWYKLHNGLIYTCEFPFSNGMIPSLTGGGSNNQLPRSYFKVVELLEELFPEDRENVELYKRIVEQEQNRVPGDIIDNHNFMVPGWGYAMLRSENGSWDRGMETLLASKYLLSDPGDHVSQDCLGVVIYGLGTILTPRYGMSWVGFLPPFLNQVMIDNNQNGNKYYGSYWHYDGRKQLPCAVAHTGDGKNCSELDFNISRWCIQFPEYLFDAYFIAAKDLSEHHYDWFLINMGNLEVVEPVGLSWQNYTEFLASYLPEPGSRGAGERMIASKSTGRIVADWRFTNGLWDWDVHTDEKLLRYPPQHSGKLRLIMSDNGEDFLVKVEIGYPSTPSDFQANSQDILGVHKSGASHVFVDTLEPIADDEEAYVLYVDVTEKGNHQQCLVKITTIDGEDWIYLSGYWGARPDGDQPVTSIRTDADIIVWRVNNNTVKRVYIAGGSYADTPHGSWDFGYIGSHYIGDGGDI